MPVVLTTTGDGGPGGGDGGPGAGFQAGPRQDWQFILGPPTGGWVTPLAQATARSITWRLTDAHDASFTVNATAGLAAGITASKTVQPGDLIGEKIDDLAYVDIGGFDWDIQPSDQTQHTFDLWPAGHGQDRGVVLQYGDGTTGSNWQRDTDTSAFADALRMTGGTPSTGTGPSPVEVTTAGIGTRPEGRWDA